MDPGYPFPTGTEAQLTSPEEGHDGARPEPGHTLEWLSLAALLLCVDYVTGLFVRFPITFVIPVGLAAWHSGRTVGVAVAVVMSIVRLGFHPLWGFPSSLPEMLTSTLIRVLMLSGYAVLVAQVSHQRRLLSARVEALEGILPICGFCKKIRHEEGRWEPIEKYVSHHLKGSFSHGLCPECIEHHYGEVLGSAEDLERVPGRASGHHEDR